MDISKFKRPNRPYGFPFYRKPKDLLTKHSAPGLAGFGGPEPPPRVFSLSGGADDEAGEKVRLIRDKVVMPALAPTPYGIPYVRTVLSEILWGAPRNTNGHNKADIAKRIFYWVQSRIRYVNDPVNREVFTAFPEILKRGIGDCDDFTAALCVLFAAAGIPTKARIIKTKQSQGWSHIYVLGQLNGRWIPFDGTERMPPGWEYPYRVEQKDFEVFP